MSRFYPGKRIRVTLISVEDIVLQGYREIWKTEIPAVFLSYLDDCMARVELPNRLPNVWDNIGINPYRRDVKKHEYLINVKYVR